MKINNKVKAYVALAASFAALEVNSQVVCVTPNVGPFTADVGDNPKVSFELDIDGDGTNDFQIMENGSSSYSGTPNNNSFDRNAHIGIAGVNGAGILASSSSFYTPPIVLSYSQTINSLAGNFYASTAAQSSFSYNVGFRLGASYSSGYYAIIGSPGSSFATGYSFSSNNILNGGAPAYIGIEFDAGGDATTNYGWIEVQSTAIGPAGTGASSTAAVQVEILSYGYQ